MMLLLCKIKSSISIKLKTTLRWLISKVKLEECLESSDGKGLAIVITVGNSIEVSQLCSEKLRFERALKVVKKYLEIGTSTIYMNYARIGYDQMVRCDNREPQYIICIRIYKVESYKYRVTE